MTGAEETEMGGWCRGWCKSEEEEEGLVECRENREEKNWQKGLHVLSRPPCSVVFELLHM